MKKKAGMILLIFAVLFLAPVTARADKLEGSSDWIVVFTGDSKMESNFTASDLNQVMNGMQPGDSAVITLKMRNDNSADTDWYMMNEVVSSLERSTEASAAAGAAYTYKLVYTGPDGRQKELYNSDKVGGDQTTDNDETGLEQATNALKDYLYLGTLKSRQSGRIVLEIALDGNSVSNAYQDTRADLQMQFAVELANTGGGRPRTVRTGDETDLAPLVLASFVSGLVLMIIAGSRWKKRDDGRERRRA